MTPPKERILPGLPGHGASIPDLREFLTAGLGPPPGYLVYSYTRNGRDKKDSAELVLAAPGGGRVAYFFDDQTGLASYTRLRAEIASKTDALCRVPVLTKAEAEDIWVALCALADNLVERDQRDETRDILDGYVEACAVITGLSVKPPGTFDALRALKARPTFDRAAAVDRSYPRPHDLKPTVAPSLLLDAVTGWRYIRAIELATWMRHVVGVGSLSQPTLDSRMAAIGGLAHDVEVRRGSEHPHLRLYRLPLPKDDA